MISSAALLLLALQNKFSSLFNRFRLLNEERRLLEQRLDRSPIDNERLHSLKLQLEELIRRTMQVKNAIHFNYVAILCFIATSVFLFLNRYSVLPLAYPSVFIFLAGMICIFVAILFMVMETRLAFHILQLEKKS